MLKSRYCAIAVVLGVALCGCSERVPPVATVSGTVTLPNGSPLPGGKIEFHSLAGQLLATATIKGDGTYEIPTIPQGECKLTVDNQDLKGVTAPPPNLAAMPGADRKYVPIDAKFAKAETSGLTVNVNQLKMTHDIRLK